MLREHSQVEQYLPSLFESLAETFEDLPEEPGFTAPYPFTKLVVNLGAQLEGHLDPTDDGGCLIVPFGEWEGAELCLYNAGLVLELRSGDGVVFPSDRISHFNLLMSGLRGSLVMATDKGLRAWRKTRNCWEHAIH